MSLTQSQSNQDKNTNTGYVGEVELGGLGFDWGATSSASASVSAPVTFTAGAKQVLSGSSSASDTMSGLLKIGLTIAALSVLFYFLKGRK